MLPLIIVVSAFTVLRTAGSLGVRELASWRTCLRWSLALMFLVTASGHWGSRRADLMAMVPPMFPSPGLLVTLTGILEIAGAVGLMMPRTSRLAALCLAVMLVAMFPANVYAARNNLSIGGRPATALPLRTAVQAGLVAATAAIASGSGAWSERRRRLVPIAKAAAE
jgi:uncharacterized membrane protein